MTLRRQQFRCLLTAMIVQCCAAVSSTDVTLKACNYAPENFYIINASDPSRLFPHGYVECANATETNVALCGVCSCREKKVESVSGVTVAWILCVGFEDKTMCVNSGASSREFCVSTGISNSQDSSSSINGIDIDVNSDASSHMGNIDGSDDFAGANTISVDMPDSSIELNVVGDSSEANGEASSAPVKMDLNVSSGEDAASTKASKTPTKIDLSPSSNSTINGSSIDTIVSFDDSDVVSNSTANTTKAKPSALSSKESEIGENDVIAADFGTIPPEPTNAPTSIEEYAIQPSKDESAQHLDTTNGSSIKSDWSGTRLMAILTLIGGFATIAVLSVIIAVRKNQASKDMELGTPTEDDDPTLAMPVTHQFDGKYHARKINTGRSTVESCDSSTLASVVVVGGSDNYLYASRQHHRLYSEAEGKMPGSFARFDSAQASNSEGRLDTSYYYNAIGASQLQFNASQGPPALNLPSPALYPIYDTSNTQVRFSSILSSDCAQPLSERIFESEESSIDSYRKSSGTYTKDRLHGSEALREPRKRKLEQQRTNSDIFDPTKSFASSLSSYEYATRDTEASEHIHPSELGTNSSCMAMSFDLGSGSLSGGLYRHEN